MLQLVQQVFHGIHRRSVVVMEDLDTVLLESNAIMKLMQQLSRK
jgi:hypothetical protein